MSTPDRYDPAQAGPYNMAMPAGGLPSMSRAGPQPPVVAPSMGQNLPPLVPVLGGGGGGRAGSGMGSMFGASGFGAGTGGGAASDWRSLSPGLPADQAGARAGAAFMASPEGSKYLTPEVANWLAARDEARVKAREAGLAEAGIGMLSPSQEAYHPGYTDRYWRARKNSAMGDISNAYEVQKQVAKDRLARGGSPIAYQRDLARIEREKQLAMAKARTGVDTEREEQGWQARMQASNAYLQWLKSQPWKTTPWREYEQYGYSTSPEQRAMAMAGSNAGRILPRGARDPLAEVAGRARNLGALGEAMGKSPEEIQKAIGRLRVPG